LEILGAPVLHLELTVDRPRAFVAVRLNDVKPDGSATRVTFGLLNLCHRDGHETPALLEPGRRYTVAMQLNDAAYAFAAGHRLRVSLSTTYWPMVWPSPEAATLTVFTGASRLSLPVRPHRGDEPVVGPLGRPEEGPPMPQTQIRAGVEENTVTEDLLGRRVEVRAERGGGVFRIDEHGLEFGRNTSERLAITEADPLSAESEMRVACHVGRDDWQVRIEARTRLTAGAECFHLQADLDVYENGERIFCRSWPSQISRSFS
jgi:hypothetical protein